MFLVIRTLNWKRNEKQKGLSFLMEQKAGTEPESFTSTRTKTKKEPKYFILTGLEMIT